MRIENTSVRRTKSFKKVQMDIFKDPNVQKLIAWGEREDSVRALVLTSSMTNPYSPVDAFSDYDIIFFVRDIQPWLDDESWLDEMGKVMVVYRDPVGKWHNSDTFARITQYEHFLKVDYSIVPVELLDDFRAEASRLGRMEADLDHGYTVLLDKDGKTKGLPAPTYQAFIPKPPTEREYLTVIEEFFHEGTYLAKMLWRRDMLAAKYFLDVAGKSYKLVTMLEWLNEIEHGWTVRTTVLARGIQQRMRPELWRELEQTYVGLGLEENWEAFFRLIDLFRKVALEVGESLDFSYPVDLDQRCMEHFKWVKQLSDEKD
jgi:aminoglycoside 6-adenylyltransferase